MTKPGKKVEIVHRQSDRLVEGFDAFGASMHRDTAECLEKITFVRRRGAA